MVALTLREKQKRQTQLEIIKTALSLAAERGFDNVPIELICARTGISRATFFNYFPQKDMILTAIATSRIEMMRGLLDDQLSQRHKVKLRHVVSLFLEFCEANEELSENGRDLMLQVLLRVAGGGPLVELRRQFTAALAEVLSGLRSKGELRGDPATVAESFFALYLGTTLEWFMDPGLKRGWLSKALKSRLQVLAEGFEPGKKR